MQTRNPGNLKLCRQCRHWLPRAWASGHPTPCELARWEGDRHVQPHPSGSGPAGVEHCDGFSGLARAPTFPPAAPGLLAILLPGPGLGQSG